MNFGVGVSNVFDLLEDETDEGRGNQQNVKSQGGRQTQAAKGPVKTQEPPKKNETVGSTGQKGGRQDSQRGQPAKPQEKKPTRKEYLIGEGPAPGAKEAVEPVEDKGFVQVESRDRHSDRRTRPVVRGKRQFDRRSGTGRGKEVAKGGAGKGNWGSDRGESYTASENPEEQQEIVEPPVERELTPQEKEEKEKREKEEEERRKAEEKENNMKLLDEYLEEKKKKAPAVALPPPRAANEGSNQNQWKDFVPLKKEQPNTMKLATVKKTEPAKKEEKKEEEKDKKKEEKLSTDLLGFQAPPRQVEERRGGSGRGSRTPKGARAPRKSPSNQGRGSGAPEKPIGAFDETNFPSLATKA